MSRAGKTKTRFVLARNSGFSLIELMVSVLIGIVILNGVVQTVMSSRRAYLDNQEVSFIQENARFAIDMISRDLRMAGYFGCSITSGQIANTINSTAEDFISGIGIQGYEGEDGTTDFPDSYKNLVAEGTDSVLIRRAGNETEFFVKNQNPTTQEITLWGDHKFDAGTPLIISDTGCQFAGIFTHTGNPNTNIVKNEFTANNCTSTLKGNFDCSQCASGECANSFPASPYHTGSRVLPYYANAYFVSDSNLLPGNPALKRQKLSVVNGKPGTSTEELAIGVEDLEIIYGVDTNDDLKINEYRKADEMDIDGNSLIDGEDWNKVIAVKLNLVMRSNTEVFAQKQAKTINGNDYNDRYMRQAVSSIIQIRNKEYDSE